MLRILKALINKSLVRVLIAVTVSGGFLASCNLSLASHETTDIEIALSDFLRFSSVELSPDAEIEVSLFRSSDVEVESDLIGGLIVTLGGEPATTLNGPSPKRVKADESTAVTYTLPTSAERYRVILSVFDDGAPIGLGAVSDPFVIAGSDVGIALSISSITFATPGDDGSGFAYSIGDIGPAGGWIFYIDEEDEFDWQFLEAAPADVEELSVWSNVQEYHGLGVLSGAIGRGAQNTAEIVDQAGHETSAAQLALDYEAGGFDDWYLPPSQELALMRDNLHLDGIGNFIDDDIVGYWSSMEQGTNGTDGRFVRFDLESEWSSTTKGTEKRVRPARSF